MSENSSRISLRVITPDNFHEIVNMKVHENQKHFVASNQYSLAEAYVHPDHLPLAIYADDVPVGFLMYAFWAERQQFWIFRLMVRQEQQGHGYGRAAMNLLIERMTALPGCREIYISYEPENQVARSLYQSLGFIITGEVVSGEEVARLSLV
jgi:diamine N-acetyltransferase